MAKRGKTLEDKYIGPEPLFTGEEDFTDMGMWQKAAQWYNYFYQPKDYQPDVLRFSKEYSNYLQLDCHRAESMFYQFLTQLVVIQQ